ncbi:MAG: cupin domain-containing protein [Succinivibrio sp.]|nr:cupin domain-containing protein [Succinivibrio sp.]
MYTLHDSEKEFRFGDSGPKYLMKGPRMNFAIVQFQSGQDFPAHYHKIMEENFYILEGHIDIVVDEKVNHLGPGDFIHIEPSEVHYCYNPYQEKIVMISTLAPYQESDKQNVDSAPYRERAQRDTEH